MIDGNWIIIGIIISFYYNRYNRIYCCYNLHYILLHLYNYTIIILTKRKILLSISSSYIRSSRNTHHTTRENTFNDNLQPGVALNVNRPENDGNVFLIPKIHYDEIIDHLQTLIAVNEQAEIVAELEDPKFLKEPKSKADHVAYLKHNFKAKYEAIPDATLHKNSSLTKLKEMLTSARDEAAAEAAAAAATTATV